MTVSDRDVYAAIEDLVLLLGTESDPLARLRLLTLASDLATQTLGQATDKALYESRLGTSTIDDVVHLSGWPRHKVKVAIRRHCATYDLPLPYKDRGPLEYVPIM